MPTSSTLLLQSVKRLYLFTRGCEKICSVYRRSAVLEKTCKKWLKKFERGDFNFDDHPKSGRKCQISLDFLKEKFEKQPKTTTRKLAEEFKCNPKTISNGLKKLGKKRKLSQWIPHDLSKEQKIKRVETCTKLLAKHEKTGAHKSRFLHRIVTRDEKWCLYANVIRERDWLSLKQSLTPMPKPSLHQQKIMLCVWWDAFGIIHHKFLQKNQSIDSELYVQQLERVSKTLKQKCQYKKFFLLHDNTRPHTSKKTQAAINDFNFELLSHPPYSPNLAPTDFYLFLSLSN